MKKSNIEKYNDSLTSAERIANARKSGIASGKARREGRIMREALLAALDQEGMMEKISKVLIDKALAGDVSAIRLLRDSIGEMPSMAINLEEHIHKEVRLFATKPEQVEAFRQVEGWLPEVRFHITYFGKKEDLAGINLDCCNLVEDDCE